MPNGVVFAQKKPSREGLAVAGILGLGGIGLIVWALTQQGKETGPGPVAPPCFGGTLRNLRCLTLDQMADGTPALITEATDEGIIMAQVVAPTIEYQGPGGDTFTGFFITQRIGGEDVTVAASGLAAVHVGPSTGGFMTFPLVSPDQPEPPGCRPQALCAYPWPGTKSAVFICGTPPQPGPADAWIEVFQRCTTADVDGFASPTCNPRVPIHVRKWPGKFTLVAG